MMQIKRIKDKENCGESLLQFNGLTVFTHGACKLREPAAVQHGNHQIALGAF
jgi:hypothetical protein